MANNTATATSPLAGYAPIEGRIGLRELPCCGKINLRGNADDETFLRAVNDALGMQLPLTANTVTVGDNGTIFWLAHDEWLLHCDIKDAADLLAKLTAELADIHHAATDLTDYYTVLELTGDAAAEVLARGCPLDLHDDKFGIGACAQSRFGNATILLYKHEKHAFQIQIRWSFADYLWQYLTRVINIL